MQADFWRERWQLNQIGFHQPDTNPYLRTYWNQLDVAAGSPVFVPLCGKSRDMLWLRGQGHPVIGAEISELAVQAFFEENDLDATVSQHGRFNVYEAEGIRLFCGDFFDLTTADLQGARGVYDRASLIALPPEMRLRYARHMRSLLAPGARTLLISFEYPQHEMQGPPFSVDEAQVHEFYAKDCSIRLLHMADILEQEQRFRERGVTRLQEKVFVLEYN
jgi:thiopurine S-methyltransferase